MNKVFKLKKEKQSCQLLYKEVTLRVVALNQMKVQAPFIQKINSTNTWRR